MSHILTQTLKKWRAWNSMSLVLNLSLAYVYLPKLLNVIHLAAYQMSSKRVTMYKYNDNVIVKRLDGSTYSGKVVNEIKTDYYLVAYLFKGEIVMGTFHESRIENFNGATFKVAS